MMSDSFMNQQIVFVSKHNIFPSKDQPRKFLTPEDIEKKRQQLIKDGQVAPLLLMPANEKGQHEIVDGECRWRAALGIDDADLELLRAEIYQGDQSDKARILITQLLRNDDGSVPLTAMERGVAYKSLMDSLQDDEEKGSPMKQAAELLGLDYSEFSRRLKVAEVSERVAGFVLEHGIQDSKVINGIAKVQQRGTQERFERLLDEIRDNEVKKESGEKAVGVREIVAQAVKEVKDPKAKKVVAEKIKRKLDVRGIEFKFKDGADCMIVKTPREVITLKITPELAAKFKALELVEVETNTAHFTL